MSDSFSTQLAEPVYSLWSTLREQGVDAAVQRALELVARGATPQLHADMCASAGRFEAAYHSASQTLMQAQAHNSAQHDNGARHARLALFADALGDIDAARRNSEAA